MNSAKTLKSTLLANFRLQEFAKNPEEGVLEGRVLAKNPVGTLSGLESTLAGAGLTSDGCLEKIFGGSGFLLKSGFVMRVT